MAPSADLIVVKGTREDGSLGFYSADIINALSFIDEQAAILAQPYVVNLSLGSTFCSHDGRSLEEQAIDALVGPGVSGKAAVIAAGNASANRSSHFHHFSETAYVGLDSSHTLTVPTYTPNPDPGNDRILVDIWYEGRDELAITVTGPASCGSPVITADFGHYQDQPTACGDVFIANMGGANPLNGDMEAIVLIDDWSGTPPAPGDWTITFTGEAIGDDGVYHGWLAEESMVGQTSPYLSANADNRYLVGKPGGATNGITVGSYALHDASAGSRFLTSWTDVNGIGRIDSSAVDGDISNFSSPGPTRDGRVKPDLAAPGERVMGAVSQDAWPGVSPVSIYQYHPWPEADALLTDDTTDHAFGMLQGTSFAAPVVTGLAARLLSDRPDPRRHPGPQHANQHSRRRRDHGRRPERRVGLRQGRSDRGHQHTAAVGPPNHHRSPPRRLRRRAVQRGAHRFGGDVALYLVGRFGSATGRPLHRFKWAVLGSTHHRGCCLVHHRSNRRRCVTSNRNTPIPSHDLRVPIP